MFWTFHAILCVCLRAAICVIILYAGSLAGVSVPYVAEVSICELHVVFAINCA